MALPLNAPAPDIDLEGWAEGAAGRFRLSEQRGTPVVLAFYPGDDTPVCRKQLCSYQDDLDVLRGVGAQVWGISTQDVASHQRFADRRGLRFPLLADTDKRAHRAYGVAGALGLSKRSVFVVDGAGLLRWSHVSTLGLTYQDTGTIVEVLKGL
ncbi:MAG: alkyl hydroperoxide reductase/Thiol specific antioxidant/Mal allergen [Frankiales bacterium]|jgi:peroxiredoxin Q/BCP|nr:alkyl hydroperoxide reductase/Thiol specific antioxidant/Mal allergen [Frankiales bacterium]